MVRLDSRRQSFHGFGVLNKWMKQLKKTVLIMKKKLWMLVYHQISCVCVCVIPCTVFYLHGDVNLLYIG